MATSNSSNFAVTTSSIIEDALRLLDVLGVGDSVSGEDYAVCLRQLNMLVKTWQAQGVHLWTETEAIVFCESGQASYILGGSSADKSSEEDIKTELSVAAVALDTTLTVDSTAGMAASDVIGIVQDDETIHWTTIVSVDSATALTITTGLVSAAAIDQHVYAYTTIMQRPIEVSSVRYRNVDGNDILLRKYSKDDYFALSNKASSGTPMAYTVDRQRDFLKLHIYPVPDDSDGRLMVSCSRQIQDFDDSTNNPDLPIEWAETIVWNLAVALGAFFGREDKAIKISGRAIALLQGLKSWDDEQSSFYIR